MRLNRITFLKAGCNENDLFLGYAGSEILRGLYPDGLLSSRFFLKGGLKDTDLRKLISNTLEDHFLSYRQEDLEELYFELKNNENLFKQNNHLLQVIIPLHFGEDIRWLERKGINCMTPFLDVDFYEDLAYAGCIPTLGQNEGDLNDSHFKRIDNPQLSSGIINDLYPPLARLTLGKGYSPADYLFSKYYAGFKFALSKYFSTNSYVTSLYPWYFEFLISYLNDHGNEIGYFNKEKAVTYMAGLKKFREIDLLPLSKYVNVLIINRMMDKHAIKHE